MVKRGGDANIIGMIPIGQTITVPGYMFLGEKKLQGSMMGSNHFPVDMPRLVDMYLAGKLKLDEMVSRADQAGGGERRVRRDEDGADRAERDRVRRLENAQRGARCRGFS